MQEKPKQLHVPFGEAFWTRLSSGFLGFAVLAIGILDFAIPSVVVFYLLGLIFHRIHISFWTAVAISLSLSLLAIRKIIVIGVGALTTAAARAAATSLPTAVETATEPERRDVKLWWCPFCGFPCPTTDTETIDQHTKSHENNMLSTWDVGLVWKCPQCDFSCAKEERDAQMDHLNHHEGVDNGKPQ
jgi:hypothetical protein